MKDLLVRRVYTHQNGMSVVAEIDYVKKTVSLVDKDGKPKKWLFQDRTPEYLNGWRAILIAMEWAVEQIRVEFDAITEAEHEKFVEQFMALDQALKKGKGNGDA